MVQDGGLAMICDVKHGCGLNVMGMTMTVAMIPCLVHSNEHFRLL